MSIPPQLKSYAEFVASRDFRVTLSDVLKTHYSAEYRKLNIWLRDKMGWSYDIELNRKEPGKNLYTFTPPIVTDGKGQQLLFHQKA